MNHNVIKETLWHIEKAILKKTEPMYRGILQIIAEGVIKAEMAV